MMRPYTIYKIVNTLNGKVYVGSTVKLASRWGLHMKPGAGGTSNQPLYRAMRADGIENFLFGVIEQAEGDESARLAREAHWITHLDTLTPHGYNHKMPVMTCQDCLGEWMTGTQAALLITDLCGWTFPHAQVCRLADKGRIVTRKVTEDEAGGNRTRMYSRTSVISYWNARTLRDTSENHLTSL